MWRKILSLPDSTTLYPAHDYRGGLSPGSLLHPGHPGLTCTTVAEEKQHNPRLTKTREEFIELMGKLNLPYPK